jgi:shikimate kinase
MQTDHNVKSALAHVLWIGGATDAGKSTVARLLAKRHGLQLYHYDQRDLAQTQKLAETIPHYRAALTRSAEERWMGFTPQELMQRSLLHMVDRFPLVIEDLCSLPTEPMILAEGFGLTPKLILPLLSNRNQAIWLVPSEEFKWASMKRRNKPSWREQVSDPELATELLFKRDMLLAAHFRQEAVAYGLRIYEVDGAKSSEELAAVVEHQWEPLKYPIHAR